MSDKKGEVKWMAGTRNEDWESSQPVVDPKYSRVGERIRHITPSALQCSMFCGGKQCKYDNPAKWKAEEMAIQGLYSSWVTHKILATARPSSFAINEYNVIEQFKNNNIAAIMNLQHPGEHSSCGFGLEEGGFSYIPQEFMDQDVFFYNFGWDDYGVRALQSILDMVKVMDFALMDGKVAIHCHAGLGRTGVLIACYFVYSQRMKADEAINAVRRSRPKAIQTRGQIACVRDFEKFLKPMWIIFGNVSRSGDHKLFSLHHFLRRQTHILHGEEERDLRYVPKIVFVTCQRLLELAGVDFDLLTISVLKRRGFTSLTHNKSSDAVSLQQDSSSSSFSQRESSSDSADLEGTESEESCNENAAIKRGKRNSDSGVILGCASSEEDMCVDENGKAILKDRQYFDSAEADPSDFGGVEDIKPERALRHSASESALLLSGKCRAGDANSPAAELQLSLRQALLQEAKNLKSNSNQSSDIRNNTDNVVHDSKLTDSELVLTTNSEDVNSCGLKQDRGSRRSNTMPLINTNNGLSGIQGISLEDEDATNRFNSREVTNNWSNSTIESSSSDPIGSSLSSTSSTVSGRTGDSLNEASLDAVVESITRSFNAKSPDMKTANKIKQYQVDLNASDSTWRRLRAEGNACVLCSLLWIWLEHLKDPIITSKDLENISKHKEDAVKAFQNLERDKRKTLHVILYTFHKILSKSENLIKVLEQIAMVLLKETDLPKKSRSEKTIAENQGSKSLQQTKEFSILSSFIQLLCKSDIFKT